MDRHACVTHCPHHHHHHPNPHTHHHLNDAEFSCPYEIASHLWMGDVPFWLPSTGWKFDSEEFVVGLWFLRWSCVLLVATVLPCAVVLCLCTLLPVGSGDVILDEFEVFFQRQGSGIRFMVLRRLLQRNLDYSGMRLSSGYGQVVFDAFVGIITFFTSACAAAAWPFAIVNLMMIGYVSFAAAGIAAFLVLHCVFVRVSAAAARFSALLGVILKFSSSGACSAKAIKSVWLLLVLFQSCFWECSSAFSMRVGCFLPVCSRLWVPYSWFLLLGSCSFHRDSHRHHALQVLLFVFRFLQRTEERKSFEAG